MHRDGTLSAPAMTPHPPRWSSAVPSSPLPPQLTRTVYPPTPLSRAHPDGPDSLISRAASVPRLPPVGATLWRSVARPAATLSSRPAESRKTRDPGHPHAPVPFRAVTAHARRRARRRCSRALTSRRRALGDQISRAPSLALSKHARAQLEPRLRISAASRSDLSVSRPPHPRVP